MTPTKTNDPDRFLNAHKFLEYLKRHDSEITRQEFRTIRGQALNGDIEGAKKGLDNILYSRVRRAT